jgi:hypothetical protein
VKEDGALRMRIERLEAIPTVACANVDEDRDGCNVASEFVAGFLRGTTVAFVSARNSAVAEEEEEEEEDVSTKTLLPNSSAWMSFCVPLRL